jgi:hypothetical protein
VLASEYVGQYNSLTRLGKLVSLGSPSNSPSVLWPREVSEFSLAVVRFSSATASDRTRRCRLGKLLQIFGSGAFGLSLIHPGFSNEPFQFVSRLERTFVRISLRLRRRRQTRCHHVNNAAETYVLCVLDGQTFHS